MSYLVWTDELEIGIGVIDGQHRRIVDYINQLYDSSDCSDRQTVARVIADLVDYTYSHFAFEETLMEEAGYEFLSVHQQTHRAFSNRLGVLKQQFDEGGDVTATLSALLKIWLVEHIMHDDQSYAGHVRERMLRIEAKDQGAWLTDKLRRFFAH